MKRTPGNRQASWRGGSENFPCRCKECALSPRAPVAGQVELLGCLSFGLNLETRTLPCLESGLKWPHVLVAMLLKFLRQTGARALVWSSAVGYNGPVPGNSGQALFEFVQRHSNRFWYHGARFRPGVGVAGVNYREVFSGVHSPLQFLDCDSRSVRHKNLLAFE